MKIFWSELAVERVSEIAKFIEQGYPEAVEKWVEAIFNRVMQLQSFPKSGRKVPEINRKNIREIFYQNFGALLKKIGKTSEAIVLFEEGLKLYPKHAGIKRNYANLLRNERPSFSVELYIEAIQLTIGNPDACDFCISCCDDLVELLRINNLFYWNQALLQYCLSVSKPTPTILKNILCFK